ncbi:MAG: hypothetical protein BM564_05055 [Bacteroidetes bacterium MedPE-SWsnd-G2]|nr:MAG: hypothetical protein BM564_05055 [Bacteroidetes bacterium MedPE-SWsnd-G2]
MRYLILIIVLLTTLNLSAQPDSIYFKEPAIDSVISPKWENKNVAALDLSEVAFVNWNSGGSNSISALITVGGSMNYRRENLFWDNNLLMRFGINQQQDRGFSKTDDLIEINSNFGYKKDSLSNWFFSARLNFKTQFANGFNYPDESNKISHFMAPGYLFFGGGMEYTKNKERFTLYFSPLTLKYTFVLDDDLANAGAFGVTGAVYDSNGVLLLAGDQIREEVGILINSAFNTPIVKNIDMRTFVSLYTDYVNSFGNIDIDWEINFDFKVNNYVRATFGSHIKYDDDVRLIETSDIEGEVIDKGPKVQWKQILGVGVIYDF